MADFGLQAASGNIWRFPQQEASGNFAVLVCIGQAFSGGFDLSGSGWDPWQFLYRVPWKT
jgi:hypothetical protein